MRIAFDKQTAAISCQTITWLFLLFQILILAVWGYTPTNDGGAYRDLATECCKRGELYPSTFFFHNDELPFIWNIGIINLTALSLWLTHSLTPLLLCLIAMKSLTAYYMAKSASLLFGHRIALVALVLYVLYPNNWGQATMISSEIPSDCLSVVAVWLLLKGLQTTSRPYLWLLSSGLLLGLDNWFRPTATMFLVALGAYLILTQRRKALHPLTALAAGYLVFILTVGTTNYMRTGHFIYQAQSYWYSMVDECYDGAAVAPHWGQPMWPEGYPRYVEDHEQKDCFELEAIWKERSLKWLRDHKLDYLSKLPGRLYYLYQSDYDNLTVFLPDKQRAENNYILIPYRHLLSQASTLSGTQWMAFATMVLYAFVLLLALIGAILSVKGRNDWHQRLLPLLIVVLGTAMLIAVMHGETRFKSPLMPWLFVLAAVALSAASQKKPIRKKMMKRKMMKRKFLLLTAILCSHNLQGRADVGYDTISQLGLPVLSITTTDSQEPTCDYVFAPEGAFGITTTNNTKAPGRCVLTLLGDTLFDSGDYVKDQSGMTLKIRGNTSAYYSAKKPYKLKLEKKNDLFARGDSCYYDKNWVLLTEGDCFYTLFGYKVNELVGMPWTPAMKYVNLIVNDDYRGIYLLTEQVKRNADCRLNVDKQTGYIIERDAYWWNEDVYFKTDGMGIEYTFKYPDENDVTNEQTAYIKDWIEQFESALQQGGAYEQYIDLSSWASWLIAHDILGTYDSGGANIFLTKNDSTSESLLQMTTLWDFGSIMRNVKEWPRIHKDNFFYFNRLLQSRNTAFSDAYAKRWNELMPTVFKELTDYFEQFSQSATAQAIDRSRPYEYNRWGNYDDVMTSQNIADIQQWLTARQQWLTETVSAIRDLPLADSQTKRRQQARNLLGQPVSEQSYRGVIVKDGKKIFGKW